MGRSFDLRKLDGAEPVLRDPEDGVATVAFDFDGTLTVKDSFMAFLRWHAGRARYAAGLARLAAPAGAWIFHRDRGRLKEAAVKEFLAGMTREELEAQARVFAEKTARRLLRPEAVATWKRWQAEGATLAIVTASPETIVAPFARGLGAQHLIGTVLEFDEDDRVTGAFAGENCRGEEKVRRLKATFGEDLRLAAAYGDTDGDAEMLSIADEKAFRVFRDKPAR